MAENEEDAYEVGYGKPPVHNRFKPGQSGNPRGRPSGSKNLKTMLAETLREKVVVTDNGKRKSISKGAALLTQLVNKAAQGDMRAIGLLVRPIVSPDESEATPSGPLARFIIEK